MDDPDSWLWLWLLAALFFALGEMATPGTFFLLPFAVGAVAAALVAFLDLSIVVEWAVFVGVSIATLLAFRPLARRLDRSGHDDGIGSRRLLGQDAMVLSDIPGSVDAGLGLVLIGREEWRAESTDGTPIPSGTQVKVADVRGTRVVVSSRGAHSRGDESTR
jgi:membrane protein implicated in regulation of membrane protease activity